MFNMNHGYLSIGVRNLIHGSPRTRSRRLNRTARSGHVAPPSAMTEHYDQLLRWGRTRKNLVAQACEIRLPNSCFMKSSIIPPLPTHVFPSKRSTVQRTSEPHPKRPWVSAIT